MLPKRHSTELHSRDKLADLVAVERSNLGLHSLGVTPLRKSALDSKVFDLRSEKALRVDNDMSALVEDIEGVVLRLVGRNVKTRNGTRENPVVVDERIEVIRSITRAAILTS